MPLSQNPAEENMLLDALARGDESAFTTLYERHWESLYITAFYVLQDQQLARDVVQDVFSWLWENRASLGIHTTAGGYLRAAAKFKAANIIRHQKVKARVFERISQVSVPSAEEITPGLEAKELQQVIEDAVNALPEKCQQIYRMSRQQHLQNKAIAAALGISEKTVENQLTIALRKLRQSVGYALLVGLLS